MLRSLKMHNTRPLSDLRMVVEMLILENGAAAECTIGIAEDGQLDFVFHEQPPLTEDAELILAEDCEL